MFLLRRDGPFSIPTYHRHVHPFGSHLSIFYYIAIFFSCQFLRGLCIYLIIRTFHHPNCGMQERI